MKKIIYESPLKFYKKGYLLKARKQNMKTTKIFWISQKVIIVDLFGEIFTPKFPIIIFLN